jgi:hypothetical protein
MSIPTGLLTTMQMVVAGSQRLFDGLGGVSAACAAGGVVTATLNSYLSTVLIARGLATQLEPGRGGKALG